MSLTGKTPIAFFAFNRPSHTALALVNLSRCSRLDECHVFAFCDGTRSDDDLPAVNETRSVVREWVAQHGGTAIERESNLGLAGSITSGVTKLCSEFGRVIVLEDDLVVRTGFLDYMLEALERYRDQEQVVQVSGYLFPVDPFPERTAFFLPLTTTWGWATWERAWNRFDPCNVPDLNSLDDDSVSDRFDLGGAYPYSTMLRQRLAGLNNSWGILWWWRVFRLGGKVLYPPASLVWVGGFDSTGTHCGEGGEFNRGTLEKFSSTAGAGLFRLPSEVSVNERVFDQVKSFLRQQNQVPAGSIMASVRKSLGRLRASLGLR